MDNRITKKRLSDLFSYEWIMMIIIAILVIVAWEFLYSASAVRLTVGQQFKFYYDTSISGSEVEMYGLFEKDKTFSYDVLTIDGENLSSDFNVLSTRLTIQEGDILITDCKEPAEDAEDKSMQVKSMIDKHNGYSYDQMLKDAKEYLLGYLKDDVESPFDKHNFDVNNIDGAKVSAKFRSRMKKDNRFRHEEQIIEGIKEETARIENLYQDVIKFDYLLSLRESKPELFFTYTKYEQRRDQQELQEDKDRWDKLVKVEENAGRNNNIYALKVGALTNFATSEDKNDPSKYFMMKGADNAEDVVIMVFDFRSYQPHLQYETISFINAIVEDCSNIYDGLFN